MTWWKTGARLAVAFGLLTLVATRIDWNAFLEVAAQARFKWLGVAFAVSTLDRIVMASKWRYLLRALNVQISLVASIVHYYMGGLVGTAVQWHVGGDIARAVSMGRQTNQHSAVTTSVVLEKIGGLQALTTLAVGSFLLLNAQIDFLRWTVATVAAMGALFIVGIVPFLIEIPLALSCIAEKLSTWTRLGKLRKTLESAVTYYLLHPELKRRYVWFLCFTLLEQLLPTLLLLIFTKAFGVELSFIDILAVLPIITLLSRLPISIESLGVMEGLSIFFLGLVGVAGSTAFLLALASRLMDMLVMGLGALVCSLTPQWNLSKVAVQQTKSSQ